MRDDIKHLGEITSIIVHSLGGAEEAFTFQRRDVAMAFLAGIIARTDLPQWRKFRSETLTWGNQIHVYV